MNDLTYVQAVILGIIQGLTEFLPVSSKGHLALTQHLMNLNPESDALLFFDLMLHIGTVGSILAVFGIVIFRFFVRLAQECSPDYKGRRLACKMAMRAVVATIPVAVVGALFHEFFESTFAKPQWTGVGLLFTGTLLWAADTWSRPHHGRRRFDTWRAWVIGLGQCAALLPGVSRSGSTISTALLVGLKRRWAAEFSFLIAIPAVLGATALKTFKIMRDSPELVRSLDPGPLAVGGCVALVVGYAALILLVKAVRRAKLHWFSYYCWTVGLAVLFWMR